MEIMKEFGIPSQIVRLLKVILKKTKNRVKIQGKVSVSKRL
jgi:hypothetical protein